MKNPLPQRERRLFVALGERSVALACMVSGWRSWQVQAQQVLPLETDVSAPALLTVLRTFMAAHHMPTGTAVHWFLPPDILAVAFVPQAMDTLDTQWLPYSPAVVSVQALAGNAQFTTALWIHRNWVDVFRSASEQAGASALYLHPRALYLTTLLSAESPQKDSTHALRIWREGNDWHVFHRQHGLIRSLTPSADVSPELTPTRLGLELTQILDTLGLPPAGVLNAAGQVQAQQVVDVPQRLARSTGPVATEWRLSSAQLHACGLMLGRLTPWIERRVRHGLMGVVLLMGLAGAGVWQHDQQLQTQQRDMSAQLKTLLPVVDDVQALKTQTTLQAQVLGVQEAARAHPIDWGALAGVLNHVPKGAAIQALRLENNELQADLLFVSDKAVVAPWAIPNATHPPLSEVADSRQQGDKGTVRLSYTTPLTTTPQGEP